MQQVEAWKTDDGQVFLEPGDAAVHEFRAYAMVLYGEAATAMMLQESAELVRRLTALRDVGPCTFVAAAAAPPPAPRIQAAIKRVGQFLVPVHLADDVLEVVLTGCDFEGLPPVAVVGNNRAYVACHPGFDQVVTRPGAPPPSYEWTMKMDENLERSVYWTRKQAP